MVVGEKDLAFGPRYLKANAEKYGVRLVSTNAVDRDTKEPIFAPYLIREKKGVKVAFLGITSPERHIIAQSESKLLDHKIKLLDPTEQTLKSWKAAGLTKFHRSTACWLENRQAKWITKAACHSIRMAKARGDWSNGLRSAHRGCIVEVWLNSKLLRHHSLPTRSESGFPESFTSSNSRRYPKA